MSSAQSKASSTKKNLTYIKDTAGDQMITKIPKVSENSTVKDVLEILAKGRQSSMTKPGGIPRLIERERAAHGRTQVSNVDLRGLEGYLTPEGIRRAEQIGEAMEYA